MKTRNKMISLLLTVIFMFTIIPAVAVNAASCYTVSFDANGGSGTMEELTVCKDTIGDFSFEAPACGFTAPFAKEFAGWSLNGVVFRPGDTIKISGNVTLKATWTDIQTYITVSFNPNGGSGTMPSIAVAVDEDGMGKFYFPECDFIPPEGKEFAGWYWADPVFKTFQPGFLWWLEYDKYTTVVLKALWKDDEKYTIKFDPNGGSGTMPDIRILPSSSGNAELTLPECTFTPPAGMEFDQWNFGNPGETVYVSGSATCKAIWKEVPVALSITSQPSDFTGPIGSKAIFSIEAIGNGLEYQWQYYSKGTWKNSGATGNKTPQVTVDVTNARDGMKFRCVVTDGYGNEKISDEVAIHLGTVLEITKQPEDFTGPVGNQATFSIAANGDDLKYQWQYYSNGTWKNSGATGNKTSKLTVDITNARNGMKFRCLVTDRYGNEKLSGEAAIHVGSLLEITKQPSNFTGPVGSTATFSITAKGDGLKYQWQYYSNGTWKNSGATGNKTAKLTVDITSARNGMKFRCVVTDKYGNEKTSNIVILNVGTTLKITKQPSNYSGTVGSKATFSITAKGDGLKYQWQYYSNGTWKNSGATGNKTSKITLDVTSARNGMKFRCVVTDKYGNEKISDYAYIKVVAS